MKYMYRILLVLAVLAISNTTSWAQTNNDRISGIRDGFAHHKYDAGQTHVLEIRNGELWGCGRNNLGQLGDGTNTHRNIFVKAGNSNNWISVATGVQHSLGIKADGTLWAWGYNIYGQLGDGTTTAKNTPTQIGTAKDWRSISAGFECSFGIKADGTLWAWGYNWNGRLGDGTNVDKTVPVQIGTSTNWVTVSAGEAHCLGLKSDGTLWVWGYNVYGQLGDGTTTDKFSPLQIGTAKDWLYIAAGANHSMAIKTNGTLWVWGQNTYGQLGDNTTIDKTSPLQIGTATNWVGVDGGYNHSVALKSDGTRWAWGLGVSGQLGDGTNNSQFQPTQMGTDNNWVSISAGHSYTYGLKSNGSFCSWGICSFGQIGTGSFGINEHSPVQINTVDDWVTVDAGSYHNHAIKADGTLWAWGYDPSGELGLGSVGMKNVHTKVGTATNWMRISAGGSHSVGLRADGTLWAWGNNGYGQLGVTTTGHNTPTQVGSANDWVSISAGLDHTLAIKANGTLWSWGRNANGQLGDNTTNNRNTPGQVGSANNWVAVAAGVFHNLALKSDGTLWAWGSNNAGQLGDGTTVDKLVPVQIGTAQDWVSVAAGGEHSLALKADGTLWSWGSNYRGQLGTGSSGDKTTPFQVGLTYKWVSIAAGKNHSIGITSDGTLATWGYDSFGQLGDGNTSSNQIYIVPISTDNWVCITGGEQHSLIINAERKKICGSGFNNQGQLGDGTYNSSAYFICSCTPGSFSSQPDAKTLCANGNTYFRVKTKYTATYKWQVNTGSGWATVPNTGIYSGTTTDSLVLTNVPAAYNTFQYRCVSYTVCNDSVISTPALLTVNELPLVTTQPVNSTICANTNTSFTLVATGASITYQWQLYNGTAWSSLANSGIYSGVTSNTLTLTSATTAENGYKYRCIITGTCTPPDTSDEVTLTITTTLSAPPVTTQPKDTTVCINANAGFSVQAAGSGLNYKWQVNDGSGWNDLVNSGTYSGVATNQLGISAATSGMNGYQYRCKVILACAPITISDAKTLTVASPVTPSVSVTANNTNICSGQTVTFTATPVNTGTNPTYQWKVNSLNVGTSAPTYAYIPANGDVVTVVITITSPGCFTSNTTTSTGYTVTATTPVSPTISINTPSTNTCSGTLITYTSTTNVTGGTYEWYVNSMLIPTATGNSYTYAPANGDIISCTVTIPAGGCYLSTSASSNNVTMNVGPPTSVPTVSVAADKIQVCQGETVNYLATTNVPGATYEWRVNGNIAGANSSAFAHVPSTGDQVTCTIIVPANTCFTLPSVTSTAVIVQVNTLTVPSISIASSNANPVCEGTNVTFTSTTNIGNGTYIWKVNGVNVGGNNATYSYVPPNGDIIFCTVIAPAGCYTASYAASPITVLKVDAKVPASINLGASPIVEIGKTVYVNTTVPVGITNYSIEWKRNGTAFATTNTNTTSYIKAQGIDTLTGVLTTADGCYSPGTSPEIYVYSVGVGVNDVIKTSGIEVFPNPFTDRITVKGIGATDKLILFDMTGRNIPATITMGNAGTTLIFSNISSGAYVLKVLDAIGNVKANIPLRKM